MAYLHGYGIAGGYGGGAASSTMNNCTLSGNTGGYFVRVVVGH